MICPYCSQENIEGVEECVNCGHSLAGIDLPGGGVKGKRAPAFVHEPLSRLPKREAVSVGLQDPVGLAVRLMQTRSIGCILVKDGSKVAGIITGWDLLQKVAGATEDLNARTCRQIMTPDPICLHDDDTVATALNVMSSGGFRHLPILGPDNQPAGVIDVGDIFRDISLNLV
jgi:CBS domain-containing protein